MRCLAMAIFTALFVSACGRSVTVTGTMDDDADADVVWQYEGDARSVVEADSFRLEGLRGDPLDLRFTSEDGLHARMDLRDLPGGSRLHLVDVWIEDGVAYPSQIEVDGGGLVTINGIRMGDDDALPDDLDERGVVLSVGRSGDALLLRPLNDRVPDLRVVVTPATAIMSPDGDPMPEGGAGVGDTIRVVGTTEAGYLVVREMVIPRRSEVRPSDADDGDDDERGRNDELSDKDEREQDRGRGRGRGKGKGKGGEERE